MLLKCTADGIPIKVNGAAGNQGNVARGENLIIIWGIILMIFFNELGSSENRVMNDQLAGELSTFR